MKVYTFTLGPLATNTYFCVGDDGECVVIDPGMDGEGIAQKLLSKRLTPTHILLTHGHFDHVQGVRYLAEKTGAVVCIHRADAEMLSNPAKNSAVFYYRGDLSAFPRAKADVLLEEKSVVECGALRFSVMHTPGHTPGSVAFICEDHIFCGDTLFCYGYGRFDLYGGDRAALCASLRRFLNIEGSYKLCPGHGNTVSLAKAQEHIGTYLEELQENPA